MQKAKHHNEDQATMEFESDGQRYRINSQGVIEGWTDSHGWLEVRVETRRLKPGIRKVKK